MRKLLLFLLTSAPLVVGQQSLTVTASRSVSPQPDEVVFEISFTSPLNAGLDDVLSALSGTPVTAGNLLTVNTSGPQQNPTLQWIFSLSVPLRNIKDTIASLTAIQQKLAQNRMGPGIMFTAQGAQVSPQLQASQQCPIADLIADARTQAQRMVSGTGFAVGPILALSEANLNPPAPVVPTLALRAGDFTSSQIGSLLLGLQAALLPLVATPPLNCAITVSFGTTGAQ